MTTECEPGEHCFRLEVDSDGSGDEWIVFVCALCKVETTDPALYDKPEEE